MGIRLKSLAALGALSLVAAPVIAQAADAGQTTASRTGEARGKESKIEGGGWFLAIPALAAIIVAIVLVADQEDDTPTSP